MKTLTALLTALTVALAAPTPPAQAGNFEDLTFYVCSEASTVEGVNRATNLLAETASEQLNYELAYQMGRGLLYHALTNVCPEHFHNLYPLVQGETAETTDNYKQFVLITGLKSRFD